MVDWYQYTALSEPRCTRVLRLHSALAMSDPLECNLEERSLNDKNQVSGEPFTALSYAWGQPSSGQYITCENKKISITKNCDIALRQIREIAGQDSPMLWVDAICVDQSNLEERSQQVQIFAHIYSSAERTWIWLGEKTQCTEHAVKLLIMSSRHGMRLDSGGHRMPIFHDPQGLKDKISAIAGIYARQMYEFKLHADI